MLVAVLSDIHGVMPALEAVLAEPDVGAADLVVLTGDLASGPQPVETLDTLRALGDRAVWVRGNADRELVQCRTRSRHGQLSNCATIRLSCSPGCRCRQRWIWGGRARPCSATRLRGTTKRSSSLTHVLTAGPKSSPTSTPRSAPSSAGTPTCRSRVSRTSDW